MITWMQRHRKYLVITIWISTFAFIGAGFVGWGQYSYGEKAGAVAKVGDISISHRQWQQSYSKLYSQYNQVFQGNFDEKQAESFGLKQQALRQVIDQALILNLANSYNLEVTPEELSKVIVSQDAFFEEGKFSKKLYLNVLKQNNLNVADYEQDLRNSILIQKVLSLFQSAPLPLENKIFTTANAISDKVMFKVLTTQDITLDTSDTALKAFWQTRQQNYMNNPSYTLEVVTQELNTTTPTDAAIENEYKEFRTNFTDNDGKILELDAARSAVIASLNDKSTKKQATYKYIDFKKNKLSQDVAVESMTIDVENNPFGAAILQEVAALNPTSPYLKPRKVGQDYVVIKLVQANIATPKSFEEAKAEVLAEYLKTQGAQQLQETAAKALENFKGQESDYLTATSTTNLPGLSEEEAKMFVSKLFASTQKRGIVSVSPEKTVLFNIVDQKLALNVSTVDPQEATRLKASIFNASLIKLLESKYPTQSFVEGN